jgi:hypothetical protein
MAGTLAILKTAPIPAPATAGQTSTVGEPSLSNRGSDIMFSGNWYAASSANDGTNWSAINPYTFFPAADGGFCCDQTLHYDAKNDLTIWLLQYIKFANTNTLRIAVKKGPLNTPGGWRFWDLKPQQVDAAWTGEWFDYNHAAFSDNFLYIGTNSFSVATNGFQRFVLFRISLASLVAGAQLNISHFSTTNFSLRCVQGAKATMYFASHEGTSGRKLRVYSWPENSPTVTSRLVTITPWNPPPFSAPVSNGINWLQRPDGRITGAALGSGGILNFMWIANKQGSKRPFPYIRVVRIDSATMKVKDEPDIWGKTTAFAYPDACPNKDGVVGVTLFSGGGAAGNNNHPAHRVGYRDDAQGKWQLAVAASSTHSPFDQKWGDYLTCRKHAPVGKDWIASGFTLQGGDQRGNIVPHYVHFGIR